MKIDITALREAAKKFATTLAAHRENPRDALALIEWDESTSALTDIVDGDENNIIVALFDMFDAERQRADEYRQSACYNMAGIESNCEMYRLKADDLAAEIAALKAKLANPVVLPVVQNIGGDEWYWKDGVIRNIQQAGFPVKEE